MTVDHSSDTCRILGVPVSIIDMNRAVETIAGWVARKERRYVCACDVHSVMHAYHDAAHMAVLRGADLVTPDGQPLVWVARVRGAAGISRVCGPDLLPALCKRSLEDGWRHYFYGGGEGVAAELAARLQDRFPGLRIAGTECPPFRTLTPEEKAATVARIRASGAHVVWVGLGCPKQELWMHEHVESIGSGVLIGVGAAFDFLTERVYRAPLWMRNSGLEWLHRLISDPRRLWRRYLQQAPLFVVHSLKETAMLAASRAKQPPGPELRDGLDSS